MQVSRQSNTVAYASLGFGAIFVRWAGAPGTVTSFYRMAVAAVALAWPFLRRRKRVGALPRRALNYVLLAGVFFACDLALWSTGVMLGGANSPTLLANTAPIWVGVGALFFFREKLRTGFWVDLGIALFGASVILTAGSIQSASIGIASLLGLGAALFYAGYFLLTQRGRESIDALSCLWPATAMAALILLVINLVLRQPLSGYSLQSYASMFALGLFSQVLGWLAINHALGILPASIVAPTMLGQPIATVLLAAPLLGETLSSSQMFGGFAVLTGVYIVHRSRRQPVPGQT